MRPPQPYRSGTGFWFVWSSKRRFLIRSVEMQRDSWSPTPVQNSRLQAYDSGRVILPYFLNLVRNVAGRGCPLPSLRVAVPQIIDQLTDWAKLWREYLQIQEAEWWCFPLSSSAACRCNILGMLDHRCQKNGSGFDLRSVVLTHLRIVENPITRSQ